MKIVILDSYAVNPGDLSWDELSALGDLTVYEYTKPEERIQRAKEAEILITNKTLLPREVLENLPNVQYIGLLSTGFDAVDGIYAASRGIPVSNVPAYSTMAVAQAVFSLLFEICGHTGLHSEAVRSGEWSRNRDFSFWKKPLLEVSGKTMGIFGMGDIGTRVAQIADAFGMHVIAYSRTKKEIPYVEWVEKEELFRRADVLSLHCPLTKETEGLISRERLAQMKKSAVLINTARGKLICEKDLADALNEGNLYAAGLDVLHTEPADPENPLLRARNCIITPHIAWASQEARARLIHEASENVRAFLGGSPIHVVN